MFNHPVLKFQTNVYVQVDHYEAARHSHAALKVGHPTFCPLRCGAKGMMPSIPPASGHSLPPARPHLPAQPPPQGWCECVDVGLKAQRQLLPGSASVGDGIRPSSWKDGQRGELCTNIWLGMQC